MRSLRFLGLFLIPAALVAVGCSEQNSPTALDEAGSVSSVPTGTANAANPVVHSVTGSGQTTAVGVVGEYAGVEAWRTFSLNVLQRADGSVSGHAQYNNRANGGSIQHGKAVCMHDTGYEGWIAVGFEVTKRIADLDPSHPLLEIFRGGEGGLGDVRFGRTLRFLPQAGTSVLATYSTGDPALVESTLLPGRVLFLTSALDPAWSDLPLPGAFVPLVHEAVRYLSETSRGAARSLEVGDGTVVRVASMPEGGGVTLFTPDGEDRAVGLEAVEGAYSLELPEADRPGFWVFRSAAGDTLAALAVDVPVRESDPALLGEDELAARRGVGRGAVLTDAEGVLRVVREDRVGREIGRWFLWAAALFLLAEMLLAARFRTEGES